MLNLKWQEDWEERMGLIMGMRRASLVESISAVSRVGHGHGGNVGFSGQCMCNRMCGAGR